MEAVEPLDLAGMPKPDWMSSDGTVVLYNADCLEILPKLPDGCVDAVVTDPPYGVGFKYESHDDTNDGYMEWCNQWFAKCRLVSEVVAVSCGISNLTEWPKPTWVMCWHKPASMGRCAVGFNNWEPLLVYGKTRAGQVLDVFRACITPDESLAGHPCPKPLGWGIGAVERISKKRDTVCDPFTGSGTTGVACVRLGRRFIGIELERKYFDIACARIQRAFDDQSLFTHDQPKQEQAVMFGEKG